MKKLGIFLLVFCSLLPFVVTGQPKPNYVGQWYQHQSQGKSPERAAPFTKDQSDFTREKKFNLKANINQLTSILNTQPELVNVTVPYGDQTYTLNLAKVDVVANDFSVRTRSGNSNHHKGVQYRGIVNNNPSQLASMSLTDSDKTLFFSTGEGNFMVTKEGSEYIIFNDQDTGVPMEAFCEASDVTEQEPLIAELVTGVGCKTVNVYFECDYAFYQAKGSSSSAVTDYVMAFFNQVATLYANEDISIQISQVYVWTTPDPYASLTTPSAIMNQFKATRGTNFNGNIAHFLTTRNIGGGVSYVDVICNKPYAFGVSMVYTTYSNVPTYSWTVNVVAHELGHSLGSPHTHSCSWAGGPIDNCKPPEGTCSPGPPPTNGGTIMSYCHMTSYGINFNNGFGPLPGNLIRSRVLNATCLPSGTSTTAPTNLTTNNIGNNTATATWGAVSGTSNYSVQYKLTSATTWISAGTTSSTSMNLSGLAAASNYQWEVKADCSPWSAMATFTTTGSTSCSAPTNLTTSNISQSGATLNWGAVSGATGYTVQYKTTAATTWNTLSSTSTSLAISGLSSATNYMWQVKASCSSSYSTQATFTTSTSTSCAAPSGLATTNITGSSATLNWGAVSGATSYSVQYKTLAATTFNTTTPTTNSISISGLSSATTYVWQVKASCSASYSSQATFITSTSSGCSPPSSLTSSGITQSGATLSWAPVSGSTGYTIQYRPSISSTWTTTTTTYTSKSITGLSSGTGYVWQVKASCSSSYSSQASFTTTTGTSTSCAAPTNPITSNITTSTATFSWTPPSNAISYTVRYRLVGASGWTFRSSLTGTAVTITGLYTRRNYEWGVTAKCSNGYTSQVSTIKTFTTL